MKKYLLPSALILVFGMGLALAQNITKSVQLSQDASGPIGYDMLNNVYFPAHILSTALAGAPTISGGTAATLQAGSSDFVGQFTGGSGATSLSLTFKTPFNASPACIAAISGGTAPSALVYNMAATGINFTSNIGTGVVNYICAGAK